MTTEPAANATSPLVGLVSGCAGAVTLVYVGQPLDTVKVRMQLSTAVRAASGGHTSSLSMWSCVRDMWHQALRTGPASQPPHGASTVVVRPRCDLTPAGRTDKMTAAGRMARLLYAGTAPALLANVAENGVLFAAYGPCQRLVSFALDLFRGGGGDAEKKLSPVSMAAAGSLASLCSAFALCPTELIKVRLQAADMEESAGTTAKRRGRAGTLQVVARVWSTEGGLRGLYRGLGSTVAREMPGYYVFFLAYEACRSHLNGCWLGAAVPKTTTTASGGPSAERDEPAWVTMTAGAAAGTCLWLVVYPVDAIKSRIQATGGGENLGGSFLKTLTASVRNEGPLALYRGLSPTLLRTVPASAVMFLTVERVTTLLSGYGL